MRLRWRAQPRACAPTYLDARYGYRNVRYAIGVRAPDSPFARILESNRGAISIRQIFRGVGDGEDNSDQRPSVHRYHGDSVVA